jgi:hypothetical protein
MSVNKKAIPLWMRYIAIIMGLLFLFWLPVEDTTTFFVLFFATTICCWFAASFLITKKEEFHHSLTPFLVTGFVAGLLVTPLSLFLMAFKTGLHGHEYPDFMSQQIQSVIQKTPIWIFGGFLISLGSGIWLKNRQT